MSSARSPLLTRLVHRAPKVELHVHFEGSIGPSMLLELARRHDIQPAGGERGVEGLRERYRFSTFRSFIDLYLLISDSLRTPADFSDAIEHVAAGLAAQQVVYAEMTVTPMTHVGQGVEPQAVIEGLDEGRRRAGTMHGVDLAWVFDVVRTLPQQAEPTLAMARQAEGVVALGFSGPEPDGQSFEPFIETFARARSEGFAVLPHAGEHAGPQSIRGALEDLGGRRIGHGVRCVEDPDLVRHLVETQTPLEVCPSSNVALGVCESLPQHPLPRLMEAGLAVSINSDDPPLFNTTLVEEYERCIDAFGWDEATVRSLLANAVEHSLLGEGRKAQLIEAQDNTDLEPPRDG